MAEQFNPNEWEEDTTEGAVPPPGKVTVEISTTNGWEYIPDEENPLKQALDYFDPTLYEEEDPVTTLDYIWNQMKLGVGDTASLANALAEIVFVDPAKALAWYAGLDVKPPPNSPIDSLFQNIAKNQQAIVGVTGADLSMKAPSTAAQYIGASARAASDPVSYLLPGSKLVQGAMAATAGAGGELGGEVGKEAAPALGMDPTTGQLVGTLVGGVSSGALPITTKLPLVSFIKEQYTSFRDKMKAYKDTPNTAGVGYANRLLDRATQELTPESLVEMVDDYSRISHLLKGADIPLFVSLADNATVKAQVASLVRTDPRVRQVVEQQVAKLSKAINDKADIIFSERYTYVDTKGTLVNIKNVTPQITAIDQKINDISSSTTPTMDAEKTGKAIENLVTAKKEAVMAEMAPKYKVLLEEAEKAKVNMPASGVEMVFNFIKENKIRDIFGKGTGVDKKVLSAWSPVKETTEPSRIIIPGQEPAPVQTKTVFKEASFAQIESLKKEINRLQRGALTPDESRKLMQLESVLDEARLSIKGGYNQRLIDLDREFYARMGIPFGAHGIKEIDSKKYAEQVAPVIASKPGAMRDFLAAVGHEGYGVATNAVMSKVYTSFVKDGVLNTAGLRQYIKNNAGIIDQVPGLRDKLTKASTDVAELQRARMRLDEAATAHEKVIANNFLAKSGDTPDYQALSARMLNDPAYFNKVMTDVKSTSPEVSKSVMNNIRREVVNTAINSPEGATAYLTDPSRASAINRLFGSSYRQAVLDLAKLSDNLRKVDASKMADALAKADLEKQIMGIPISGAFSVLRDRWISWTQKAAIITSRVGTHKFDHANKKALIDLLVNSSGIEQLTKMANKAPQNSINMGKWLQKITDLTPSLFYTPAKQSLTQEQEQ